MLERIRILVGFMFWLLTSQMALADSHSPVGSVTLNPAEATSGFGDRIKVYEDVGGTLQLSDIMSLATDGAFKQLDQPNPNFGLTQSTYWLRFEVASVDSKPTDWIINLGKPYLRLAEVFLHKDNEVHSILFDGRTVRFSERSNPQRLIVSEPFTLAANESSTIWIRYGSDTSSNLNLEILSQEAFLEGQAAEDIRMAIYLTFAASLAVFTLIMALVLRSRVAVFYALFFVLILGFSAQINGVFFQSLWPNAPEFNAVIAHPLSLLGFGFGAMFGREFILFEGAPKSLKHVSLAFAVACFLCAAMPLVGDVFLARKIGSFLALLFLMIQLTNAVVAFHYKQPGSLSFLLATALLLLYVGVFAMALIFAPGYLGAQAYTLFRYGQLVEGCVFAAAVFQMTLVMRKNAAADAQLVETKTQELTQTKHDLRQPLLTLRTSIERIEDQNRNVNPDVLKRLMDSIGYLDDVLAGGAKVSGTTTSLTVSDIVDSAVFMFGEDVEEAGQKITTVGTSDLEIRDPTQLLRILSNLLSNATRHSGADHLEIVISGGRDAQIEVRDNGNGLPGHPDERGWIEEISSSSNGEGLRIIQQIAKANGWNVSFQSSMGQGVAFVISGLTSEITS